MKSILKFPLLLVITLFPIASGFADSEGYLIKCRAASKQHDLDAAIALCSTALKGDLSERKRLEAFDLRANAYQDKGQNELSIQDFGEVIRRDPDYQLAYINRGIAYKAVGDLDAAIKDYDKAIAITPGIAIAYNNRGNAYRDKGELELAIKDFDLAIKLDPTDARFYNNRGAAYDLKGDETRAISNYTRAVELDPDLASAYMGRADVLNRQGEFEKGLGDATRGVALDPEEQAGWWAKGVAEFGLARHADAAGSLDTLQKMRPRDLWVALLHYLARERSGRNGSEVLRAYAAGVDLTRWPGAIVRFYLNEVPVAEVKRGAVDTDSRCDAAFYVGQKDLLNGEWDAASSLLQEAAENCPRTLFERAWAAAELKRL